MQITISLHGIFRIDRFKLAVRSYPADTKVQEIIDDLKIPINLLGIIIINGVHAEANATLCDGDTIKLLPLLEGG